MGFIKYITVFDDESQMVLNDVLLNRYDIAAYPSVFYADGKPCFSSFNADSSDFIKMKNSCKNFVLPSIPEEIFLDAYNNAYINGFLQAVVVCPHAKWYPYYRKALAAANRYRRHRNIDFSSFAITVIDSRSFAMGPMLQTLDMAHYHNGLGCPTEVTVDFAKMEAQKSKTLILTRSDTVFGTSDGVLSAYSVFNNKLNRIDLPMLYDNIKYDKFAKSASSHLKSDSSRYSVSLGGGCDFAGNIIGRIKDITGKSPICCMQYGVTSAAVLGDNTLCIHIL